MERNKIVVENQNKMRPLYRALSFFNPHLHMKRNYNKNICRYITRTVIRAFANPEYESKVLTFCNHDLDLYYTATCYFAQKLEFINGFRALKSYLKINEGDGREMAEVKGVFIGFFEWFLKNRYVRLLLKGKMKDRK